MPSLRAVRTIFAALPGEKRLAQSGSGRKDGDMFGFAGLYDTWRDPEGGELTTCSIITTEPNMVVAPIHNRMPVILLPEDEERWLDPDMTEPAEIVRLLRPYPDSLLMAQAA